MRISRFSKYRSLILFIVMIAGCLWTAAVDADSPKPYSVMTRYLNTTAETWDNAIDWRITLENGQRMRFAESHQDDPVVQVTFDDDRMPSEATLKVGTGSQAKTIRQRPSDGILLSRGHPVPYDQLQPKKRVSGPVLLEQTISGVRFNETIDRRVDWVLASDAPSAANSPPTMIRALPPEQKLMRITISKGDALLVEQWFIEGDDFWLFEQTPIRRSWRLIDE